MINMFFEITGFECGGQAILSVIKFIMKLLDLVLFIVPILLIVMVSIDFVKNVITNDEGQMKKNFQLVIKRILMCGALFLVDPLVHFSINLLGENGVDYASCVRIALNEDLSQYKIDYSSNEGNDSQEVNLSPSSGLEVVPNKDKDNSNQGNLEQVDGTIFIGDSRFVGMKSALGSSSNEAQWISKTGEGYSWLVNTAITSLNSKIKSGKRYNIVINLGVNDMGNIDKYLNFYDKMVKYKEYKDCNIIIVSVNPIDDSLVAKYGYSVKDSMVKKFNTKLKKNLNNKIKYCDTYSKIKSTFKTTDGLHYTNNTYKKIYKEIKNCL